MKEEKKSGMENNNYKQLINESYEKFTDDVDIMWQKSGVGDLDDFIYDGLIISGYDENNKWFGRLPTEEEFINKVKSDEGFSKRWGIKIGDRELSLEERQKLCVVWTKDSYGIDGELRSPLTIDWEKTPKRAITVTYNNETIESYE
jgi:hypothetical protein